MMRKQDNKTYEFYFEFKRLSPSGMAILVTDGENEDWIPVSLIENIDDLDFTMPAGTNMEIVLPVWFAKKRGFV
jgi:hypothetical protein